MFAVVFRRSLPALACFGGVMSFSTLAAASTTPYTAVRVENFGDPTVLSKTKVLALPQPGLGQVQVKIQAFGVNPVDTYIRSGVYANKPALPYTPGHDCAGYVTALGAGVTNVKLGDRVFTSRSVTGSYATEGLFEASAVHPLPAHFSFQEGAAIGTGHATAYRALVQKGKAKPGQSVVVHGASGGVGIPTVEFAKLLGLRVIATAGNEAAIKQLLSMGCAVVLNHHTQDVLAEVMKATNGEGVDVVVEMAADKNLAQDLKMVRRGGTIVVVGSRGDSTISPREIMGRESTVTGVMLYSKTPEELAEISAAMTALFSAGLGRPSVSVVYEGFAAAPQAHVETIARATNRPGRVVVDVSREK